MKSLYIVVPCYNEAEALPVSAPVLLGKLRIEGCVAEDGLGACLAIVEVSFDCVYVSVGSGGGYHLLALYL